jgi:hypothetical protein
MRSGTRGKLIARKAYIEKEEAPQIHNLTLCLKELGKEGKTVSPKLVE